MSEGQPKAQCSFCGKSQDEVSARISGQQGAHVCEECVVVCIDVLKQEGVWPSLPVRAYRTLRYRLGGGRPTKSN